MQKLLINLIEFYQKFLSFDRGLLFVFAPGGSCKFSPSCSEYTKQAIFKYGSLRGVWLGFRRILSCNPWS